MSTIRSKQCGFTLIELILFIVIVSVGLAGILSVMNVTVKSSADPMVRKQAMAMAESLLEEILLKNYHDPDATNVGETERATWDNVADYAGKTNAALGIPDSLSAYVVAIDATNDATTRLGNLADSLPAWRITVTVTQASEVITMTGFRTCYGELNPVTGDSACL